MYRTTGAPKSFYETDEKAPLTFEGEQSKFQSSVSLCIYLHYVLFEVIVVVKYCGENEVLRKVFRILNFTEIARMISLVTRLRKLEEVWNL